MTFRRVGPVMHVFLNHPNFLDLSYQDEVYGWIEKRNQCLWQRLE